MWQSDLTDKDKLLGILYRKLIDDESARFPSICPICSHESAHIYIHRHSPERGGLWLWCGRCRYYSHGSLGAVPDWWVNPPEIDASKLAGEPGLLESFENLIIGEYINKLIAGKACGRTSKAEGEISSGHE